MFWLIMATKFWKRTSLCKNNCFLLKVKMKLINFFRLRTEALIRLAKKQNNIHIVSKEITSSELKEQKEREKEKDHLFFSFQISISASKYKFALALKIVVGAFEQNKKLP